MSVPLNSINESHKYDFPWGHIGYYGYEASEVSRPSWLAVLNQVHASHALPKIRASYPLSR